MKKRLILIISIISVLAVSALSFASCFEHHLRPVGTYQTYEYTNPENGHSYRVLLKFIQEEVDDKKGVSGKVHYAYQIKKKGEDVWKTEYIYKEQTYKTINANKQTSLIDTSERLEILTPIGYMRSTSFGDNLFNVEINAQLYKISLETIKKDALEVPGYTLTKSDETFPTETDDFAPYNNQNNG